MNQNAALLRALKGAPVSIVLALLLNPDRSLGAGKLAQLTGYSDKSITNALATLQELGLAQNHGRYKGWTLTLHCTQLILPEPENLRLEPENSRLLPVSSSSLNPETDLDPTPTTNSTRPQSRNFRLDLFHQLTEAGIYHDLARNLAADPWVTHERLDAWQANIDQQISAHPHRIKSPVGLLASNLRVHREPPRLRPAWAKYVRSEQ